jgi:mitosis inhibitor protein kinase SWE1
MLAALLCSNPVTRIDSYKVWTHPVVARTRAAMEQLLEEAQRAGELPFVASPLASVPTGFLAMVLAETAADTGTGDAMNVGA